MITFFQIYQYHFGQRNLRCPCHNSILLIRFVHSCNSCSLMAHSSTDSSSFVIYSRCVLQFSKVLALNHPHVFCIKNIRLSLVGFLSNSNISSTLIVWNTNLSCLCFISSWACFLPDLPNFLIPLFKL
jgi:hypothetical protein